MLNNMSLIVFCLLFNIYLACQNSNFPCNNFEMRLLIYMLVYSLLIAPVREISKDHIWFCLQSYFTLFSCNEWMIKIILNYRYICASNFRAFSEIFTIIKENKLHLVLRKFSQRKLNVSR